MKKAKLFKSTTLALLAGCLMTNTSHAQSFCNYYGESAINNEFEQITKIIPTEDKMAFVGWDGYFGSDMKTMVGKINSDGSLDWMKTFNIIDSVNYHSTEQAKDIIETELHDLVFVSTNGFGGFSIAKCNGTNGNLITSKYYDGYNVAKIFEQSNGNIVAFGHHGGSNRSVAILLDNNLDFIQAINLGFYCDIKNVIKTDNGNSYVGVGSLFTGDNFKQVTFSLSSTLAVNWVRMFTTNNHHTSGNSLVELNSGHILTVGQDGQCSPINDGEIILNLYSSTGLLLGTKEISNGTKCLYGVDVIKKGNSILILGTLGTASSNIVLFAFDNNGNDLGAFSYDYDSKGLSICESNSGEIFLAGRGRVTFRQGSEGYIIKLNADGTNCCADSLDYTVTNVIYSNDTIIPDMPSQFSLIPVPYGTATNFGAVTVGCSDSQSSKLVSVSTLIEEKTTVFKVYPSPASSTLNIELEKVNLGDQFKLINGLGQEILNEKISTTTVSINISELPNGIYFLTVTSNENYNTERVIINH